LRKHTFVPAMMASVHGKHLETNTTPQHHAKPNRQKHPIANEQSGFETSTPNDIYAARGWEGQALSRAITDQPLQWNIGSVHR
jgi:hypothetical protein